MCAKDLGKKMLSWKDIIFKSLLHSVLVMPIEEVLVTYNITLDVKQA